MTRSGSGTGALTVDWSTTAGTATGDTDYTSDSGTLNLADGDTDSKLIQVALINDLIVEGDETFTVNLSNVSGLGALGAFGTATVTIVDDDSNAGVLALTAASDTVSESWAQ